MRETPVEFTGKTSEYFGITLLLSIITPGIYSARAKADIHVQPKLGHARRVIELPDGWMPAILPCWRR